MSSESTSIDKHEHLRLLSALRGSELLRELAELLASSLDLTHILHVLVKRATEVCDVERCAVWLVDEENACLRPSAYHLSSLRLPSKDVQRADSIWHHSSIPLDDEFFQQLLTTQGMLYEEDLQQSSNVAARKFSQNFLIKSILLIALIREGRQVGMMSLDVPGQTWTFTTEQQQLARAIGQQAAVAIDNARLYQQAESERRHAERVTARVQALHQVALAVNAGEDTLTVLSIANRHLISGLEASGAVITLFAGEHLEVTQTLGLREVNPLTYIYAPILAELPTCHGAAQSGLPVFASQDQLHGEEARWLLQLGLENVLIVPLIVTNHSNGTRDIPLQSPFATRTSVGFALIAYKENSSEPGPEQYTFAQDIATQCAMAIERDHILSTTRHIASLALERATTLDAVFNAMNDGITVLDNQGKVLLSNNSTRQLLTTQEIDEAAPEDQLLTFFTQQSIYTLKGRRLAHEELPLIRGLRGEQIRGERVLIKRSDGSELILELNIVPLLGEGVQQRGIVSAFRDVTEQVQSEQRIRRALDTMLHAAEIVSGLTEIKDIFQRTLTMSMNILNCQRGVAQYYDENQQEFSSIVSIGTFEEKEQSWLRNQRNLLSPNDTLYAQLVQGHAVLIQPPEVLENSEMGQILLIAAPITHHEHLQGVMLLERRLQDKTGSLEGGKRHNFNNFSLWDVAIIEGIAQFTGLAIEQVRWQQEAKQAQTHEAAMRASNKLKDEFLALTAHEFRTPLTVILAHSQLIGRALKRVPMEEWPGRLHDSLENIENQTHQLTNIVNTFLEVTQLNRGQIVLQFEELNLEEVVRQAVNQHAATTERHQLSFREPRTRRAYHVKGDRARLLQIFANLLQNAIKYSPHGGPITVSLTQHSGEKGAREAEILFQDKGIGVPQDAQARLFESFYRAPNIHSAGPEARGVGLGLYVVAEFLRLHGGKIRVESKGLEGEGSCFIVTLPLLEAEEKKDLRKKGEMA